jgi:hypothetical protein
MQQISKFGFTRAVLCVTGLSLGLIAREAHAQYVYVGDYTGNEVMRFSASNTNVTDTPGGSPAGKYIDASLTTSFSGSYHPEGMGGIGSNLYIAGSDGAIHIYDVSSNTSGVATGIISQTTTGFTGGGLRINFSPTGNIMYAAGNATNGVIDSFTQSSSVFTRTHQFTSPNATGIWGVATNPLTGEVYYTTGWRSSTEATAGVYKLNADLSVPTGVPSTGTVIVASKSTPSGKISGTTTNASTITGLAGIVFKSDGTFYVVNGANATPMNDFIQHYKADGTFIDQVNLTGMTAGALNNAFDAEIGPGGDLYVAAQNGNCVVRINSSTDTFVSGYVPNGADSLQSAKTLHFTSNNIPGTPEPGTVAAGAGLLLGVGSLLGRKRLRRRLQNSAAP